jgi:fructose-1,6-bisphosphatase/inositol monophosphatase family enzyme
MTAAEDAASCDIGFADDDIALAIRLATEAGDLAERMRADGLSSTQKTSVSDIVTDADHAAEELVTSALARCRADDGILGEEGARTPSSSGRTWVIDPVDGTYNFAHGSGYWCSAIALAAAASPDQADPAVLLGVVYQPTQQRLWVGAVDHPTTCDGVPVRVLDAVDTRSVSAATYLHPTRLDNPELHQPWTRAARQVATLRMMGSGSVDLATVSHGGLGCWFQHSSPQWDWLPGKALVQAAGGAALTRSVNGFTWFVAGPPQIATQLASHLVGDPSG